MAAPHDRRYKSSRIPSPLTCWSLVPGWNQGTGKLLNVIRIHDLREGIPFHRRRTEGIEDHVASISVVKLLLVATVWVREDCTIATIEGACHELADQTVATRRSFTTL